MFRSGDIYVDARLCVDIRIDYYVKPSLEPRVISSNFVLAQPPPPELHGASDDVESSHFWIHSRA